MLPILARLLKDPPPAFVFELSEAGIAAARTTRPPQLAFQPLEPDVLAVSPVKENILRPEALAAQVRALAPATEQRKRRPVVLVLPDGVARVSVLDFDAFPPEPAEQIALLRFRIKKGLPFDVESASLGYHAQAAGNGKRVDVVTVVTPEEIVARYEAPFRAAGFQAGLVTTSTLACLQMAPRTGMAVVAKLSGKLLTLSILDRGALKLARSIQMESETPEEIVNHLHPTFAYAEDQLGARPDQVCTCGFGAGAEALRQEVERELGVPLEALLSRFGAPNARNAGLLGYLESMEELA